MLTNHTVDWQGRMLGRYRLVRPLGRGGMGEVWQAEDTALHRQVAAKLLPPVLANDQDYLRAFADEARTAAALEHAHILPVHDFGEEPFGDDIVTYLIMPLISGGSLREHIRSSPNLLPIPESMRYLRQAAQAIDYAHSRRVLHRDIKPANMLLQQGWIFLADFGIAKLLTTTLYRSRTHAGAGTPEYMAPEQAQGKAEAASDRYSLAMIAYLLFSGHLPFRGSDPYDVLIKQMTEQPPSPRQFNPQLPQSIEHTLLKGLAKRPQERPASCIAFVDELDRNWKLGALDQQDGESTLLAPWSKRYPALEPTQLVPARATPQVPQHTGGYIDQAIYPTVPGTEAPAPATMPMAETTAPSNETVPYTTTNPERQRTTQWREKIGRRGFLLVGAGAAVVIAGGAALATYYPHTMPFTAKPPPGPQKLIAGRPVVKITGHTDTVSMSTWDPTGHYLATASLDTHVMLWDLESTFQKNLHTLQTLTNPARDWKFAYGLHENALSWSPDGHMLAIVLSNAEVASDDRNKWYMVDVTKGNSTPTTYTDANQQDAFRPPTYNDLAWSPTGNMIAVSISDSADLTAWRSDQKGSPVRTFHKKSTDHTANPQDQLMLSAVGWSSDGALLAATRTDTNVPVWEVKTGTIIQELILPDRTNNQNYTARRNTLQWSPQDPHQLVTFDVDVATVWDVQKNKLLHTLGTDDSEALNNTQTPYNVPALPKINGLTWSPNGRYIAASYESSRKIYIWDLDNRQPKKSKDGVHIQDLLFGGTGGHSQTVIDLSWSPDGRYIASTSLDGTAIIWQVDGA